MVMDGQDAVPDGTGTRPSGIARQGWFSIVMSSYAQLLIIYAVLLFCIAWGILPSLFNMLLFGIVLGVIGFRLGRTDGSLPATVAFIVVVIAFLVALGVRLWALQQGGVPLGYDPGFHMFAFEHPLAEDWEKSMFPLPFLLVMGAITPIFGSEAMVTWVFAGLSALSIVAAWWSAKKIFGGTAGVMAALFFALSIAQYQMFWFNYYKNVVGVILILVSLPFFRRQEAFNWPLFVIGAAITGMHQPAFLLFGVGYACWVAFDLRHWRSRRFGNELLLGAGVLVAFVVLNYDRVGFLVGQALGVAESFMGEVTGEGTFFGLPYYLVSSLAVVPLAVTGVLLAWRRNSALMAMAVFTAIIVFFELRFNLRMIIYFDVFVLLFAAAGAAALLKARPVLGWVVVVLLCLAGVGALLAHAEGNRPHIANGELAAIKTIGSLIEPDATVLVTDGRYIPWIKGYVPLHVMSPGMLDDQPWTKKEWMLFWTGKSQQTLLARMPRPLYIYQGPRQRPFNVDPACVGSSLLNGTKLRKVLC